MTVNVRPRGNPDALAYSPLRDVANLYIPLMQETVTGLSGKIGKDYLESLGIVDPPAEEELANTLNALIEAHQLFTRNPDIKSAPEALRQAGFMDQPQAARIIIMERLGAVIMGGFFVALRDVTMQGVVHDAHQSLMDSMVAAGRLVAEQLCTRGDTQHKPLSFDTQSLRIAELENRVYELARTNKQMDEQRVRAIAKSAAAQNEAGVAKQNLRDAITPLSRLHNWAINFRRFESYGLCRRLLLAIGWAWNAKLPALPDVSDAERILGPDGSRD